MPGRILLVAKLKGGAGATTTAREIAVAAVDGNLRVGVVDLDGQGGLTRWWNRRNAPGEHPTSPATVNPALLEIPVDDLPGKSKALRRSYDLVVIDAPPSVHDAIRQVGAIADLALIPARPTTDDLDAVGPIVRLLRGTTDLGFVLTQVLAGRRSRDAAEAAELLARLAPVFGRLSLRLDYPRAASAGRTGFEAGGATREEVGALWATLRDRLNVTSSHHEPITSSGDDVIDAGD